MKTKPHDPKTIAALDDLEKLLPKLLKKWPNEGDFWPAFAGQADVIVDNATSNDRDYAQGRIDCMLKNAGMIPGESEDEPCAR